LLGYKNRIIEILKNYSSITEQFCRDVTEWVENDVVKLSDEEKNDIVELLHGCLPLQDSIMSVCIYSLIFELKEAPFIFREFICYVTDNAQLNYANKNFLFYRISSIIFMNPIYETEDILYEKWRLLEKIKQEVTLRLGMQLNRIPLDELDSEMAVVITEQFLTVEHGPTKTALDRCAVLKQKMHKKVLLINTAEFANKVGYVPFWNAPCAMYQRELCEKTEQSWKGCVIPFFQCDNVLPDLATEKLLLKEIMVLKPTIVINIGGSSLFAGLVNKLIPVLTIGTTQSGLVTTLTDYQLAHGNMDAKWLSVLQRIGKPKNHMICGTFTFSLKEQTKKTTRKEEKLPSEQFLLAVVGARLDAEVTEKFMCMLAEIVSSEIGVVFIGDFNSLSEYIERYPRLKNNTYALGYCEDVLSKLEICNLYVNPIRKGGATSAVEAMSKGLPVTTVDYGDVAGTVGKDFCCGNYAEMAEQIRHYQKDETYYKEQAQKALKMAAKCLDSQNEFTRIVKEYEAICRL
jgi:hypothetical protein